MSIKLTDTQLVLLSGAAQRDDRCLVPVTGPKRRQSQMAAVRLLEAGLVKEIRAKAGAPVWRRDDESGLNFALKLTIAGAKAIVVEDAAAVHEMNSGQTVDSEKAIVPSATTEPGLEPEPAKPIAPASSIAAPRAGTKIAQVIALLERDHGATLDELNSSTDWLPHTTRAALTGLRKRGYGVALDRSDKTRGPVYRLVATGTRNEIAAQSDERIAGAEKVQPRRSRAA